MTGDIEKYLREAFFSEDGELIMEEISEGNINHIYRVCNPATGTSLVLKQAEKESRISPEIRLSVSRGQREVSYYNCVRSLAPGAVPMIYAYNKKLHLIVMEDLRDRYEVLRDAMIAGKKMDFLAEKLAEYLVETAFFTSDFSLSHLKKKRMQRAFCNPELCDLTERLVFSEPFLGAKDNSVSRDNEEFVQKEVYANRSLKKAAAALKLKFMNEAQALIHGDFHFGSVFVSDRNMVVFDSEFCFFGPIGFDLGNLVAHFLMELLFYNVKAEGDASSFSSWLKQTLKDLVCRFERVFTEKAIYCCSDDILKTPQFIKAFVSSVLVDTAGFAGAECLRRTIGIAKIPEFGLLPDDKRAVLEREILHAGVYLMEHMAAFQSAEEFSRFLDNY